MNFGLRLDKILADVRAHSILIAAEDSVTGYDIYADPESALVRAKQTITSLIKELVAEAKPDFDNMDNYNRSFLEAMFKAFEQKLLKVLEEV